ncbi:MAG: prepilin-type N-terminal cleavage/methylation domain-containing protein, partial [Planctomycetota bacterium]
MQKSRAFTLIELLVV